MDEIEFKKLTANSRDWEIYKLLSEQSKETVLKEIEKPTTSVMEVSEKGEKTVQETIQGIVRIVTDKAVQIVIGIRSAWIPKSAIKNLKDIVLEQGKPISIDLHAWFAPKVEWRVI